MKSVLIIGIGRFGSEAIIKFNKFGHEVVAIDSVEERIKKVLPYVVDAQIGNSTDEDFLKSIGISSFDICIVAIGDKFQDSIITVSYLHQLNAKYVIARASSDIHAKLLLNNGADTIIYPEKQLGNWVAIRYGSNNIFDCMTIDNDYFISEVKVPNKWAGKTIGALNIRKKTKINIIAKKNGYSWDMDITKDTLLNKEDIILICCKNYDINQCFE